MARLFLDGGRPPPQVKLYVLTILVICLIHREIIPGFFLTRISDDLNY